MVHVVGYAVSKERNTPGVRSKKANTNPGKQNARFKGSKICATRAIQIGEEIFVPYRRGYKFNQVVVDGARSGWRIVGKRFYRDMG